MTNGFQKRALSAIGLDGKIIKNDEFLRNTGIEVLDTEAGAFDVPDNTDIYYDHRTAMRLSFEDALRTFSERTNLEAQYLINYPNASSRIHRRFHDIRKSVVEQSQDAIDLAIFKTLKDIDTHADGWFIIEQLGSDGQATYVHLITTAAEHLSAAIRKSAGRPFRSEHQFVKITADINIDNFVLEEPKKAQFKADLEKYLTENLAALLRLRFQNLVAIGFVTFITQDPIPPRPVTTMTITNTARLRISNSLDAHLAQKYGHWVLLHSEKGEPFHKIRKELGDKALLGTKNAKQFHTKMQHAINFLERVLAAKANRNSDAEKLEQDFFDTYGGGIQEG